MGKGGESIEELREQRVYVGCVTNRSTRSNAGFALRGSAASEAAVHARPASASIDAAHQRLMLRLSLSHRLPWFRARSYAVYAVYAVQVLAWVYITSDPTPRLQRKAWLDMVIYGCYVSLLLSL